MVAELGQLALCLAFGFAVLLSVIPLLGAWRGVDRWMLAGHRLALGQWLFLMMAFVALAQCFLVDDFSVRYVQGNSNSALPAIYKFSAVWGGHEGSLLLWALMLGSWTIAVSRFSGGLPAEMVARVLAVLGMVSTGFLAFMLWTSSPFVRILPRVPAEGRDLNPLLQDPGLIIHPPMLYMGYVGFSVAFAFALAALMSGRLDAAWARWSRPWTNVAWAFLTIGIALGSWWAYYELGWGGWWFWDPVENASFMPWLVGTALIHSLAVTEKRGIFKSWTLLLAIFAFSLSLLGTFLVRSGVLTSVHAFASDPSRGMFILALLVVVVGGSLVLYALRAPSVSSSASFTLLSREALLLVNNILLAVAAAIVLCGTLFPLAMDALGRGKYSVGAPYFNAMFVPLVCALAAVLGIGSRARWKRSRAAQLFGEMGAAALAAVLVGLAMPFAYGDAFDWRAAVALSLAAWVVFATLRDVAAQLRHAPRLGEGLKRLSLAYYGMVLGHIGFAVTMAGVTVTALYSEERDVRVGPGVVVEAKGYRFEYLGSEHYDGPNFSAERVNFNLYDGQALIGQLHPEKRTYAATRQVMTEADIRVGFMRDLYLALGEPLGEGAWSARVQVKEGVRWIWLGSLIMAAGGFAAVADRRYRPRRENASS